MKITITKNELENNLFICPAGTITNDSRFSKRCCLMGDFEVVDVVIKPKDKEITIK